ncbi:hypothetical protein AB0392_15015 [Nonomuraea angiospora]|uniref:hypothetical protein n=1 Tax=Nonomuraea angiospora TaxID=46172 RepID=UPI00344E85FC
MGLERVRQGSSEMELVVEDEEDEHDEEEGDVGDGEDDGAAVLGLESSEGEAGLVLGLGVGVVAGVEWLVVMGP